MLRPPPLWLATACVFVSACGSSTTTSVSAPTPLAQRCTPSFDGSQRSFGPDGGTGSVAVTVPRECSWAAATEAPWAVITAGAQGQGDGTVLFRIDRNADPVGRNSGLVIGEQRVVLAQQPAPCRFDVSPPAPAIAAEGASLRIFIGTHDVCAWEVGTDVPWVTLAPASGRGSAAVSVTVAPNPEAPRSGSMVVAGVQFSCNTGCASTHSPRPAGANASDTCPAGANASGTCPAGTDASGTCPAGTDAPGAHSPAAAAGARGRRLGARAGTLRRLPQQAIPPRQHSRDDE